MHSLKPHFGSFSIIHLVFYAGWCPYKVSLIIKLQHIFSLINWRYYAIMYVCTSHVHAVRFKTVFMKSTPIVRVGYMQPVQFVLFFFHCKYLVYTLSDDHVVFVILYQLACVLHVLSIPCYPPQ